VRDWLVSRVTTRAGLMRRARLAPRTPVRLAALQALAAAWGEDPAAVEVLQLARAGADAEMRAAAASRPRRPGATGATGVTSATPSIRVTPESAMGVPAVPAVSTPDAAPAPTERPTTTRVRT
jgi:hypothetical protein